MLLSPVASRLATLAYAIPCSLSIALVARRAGSLSRSGAVAATVVGTLALMAGWRWGVFLVGWFAASSALSRWGQRVKAQRTDGIVEKGGARDAAQVLANGGVFACCALLSIWSGSPTAVLAGSPTAVLAGTAALIAAGADTAATETGILWGATPWSLRTGTPAPPGTSGAISVAGSLGMVAAAACLAVFAAALGLVPWTAALTVMYAGIVGALADTLLGAWCQARRWCPSCAQPTEQRTHHCGTDTVPAGGLAWLTNDGVNLLCTLVGAGVAVALR